MPVADKAYMKAPKLSSFRPRGYGMALSNLPVLKKTSLKSNRRMGTSPPQKKMRKQIKQNKKRIDASSDKKRTIQRFLTFHPSSLPFFRFIHSFTPFLATPGGFFPAILGTVLPAPAPPAPAPAAPLPPALAAFMPFFIFGFAFFFTDASPDFLAEPAPPSVPGFGFRDFGVPAGDGEPAGPRGPPKRETGGLGGSGL